MPPKKYPESEDRGDAAVRNPDTDVIDLDAFRRRARTTPDTSTNNDPAEPGAEGGGAQNDPI